MNSIGSDEKSSVLMGFEKLVNFGCVGNLLGSIVDPVGLGFGILQSSAARVIEGRYGASEETEKALLWCGSPEESRVR